MLFWENIYVAISINNFLLKLVSLVYLLQVFDLYGIGLRLAYTTPSLQKELELKVTSNHYAEIGVKSYWNDKPFLDWFSFE